METAFFFLSNPASNNPRAGIINNTKLEATSIQAVSPESIGKSPYVRSCKYKAVGANNIIISENLFNERVEDIFP